ncbi:MAG: hypothetical protein IKJ27_00445 [Clostridia bacterium]|nr:hypothetical protein [Clostridia bacterium]
MKFTLYTPHCRFEPMECDSVRFNIADGADGSFSGSYGIRSGHAKALFSLSEGKISVSLGGNEVFCAECSGGFAKVENNEVTAIVDSVIQ